MKEIKIAIVGIGGVGGYYGGKLAKRYANTKDANIYFIARGENLNAIRKEGISVSTDEENFTAFPHLATDKPEKIGVCDYIIFTTKSYDLKTSLEQIAPCIGKSTVILPLLNGGNITEKMQEILPDAEIWSGCTYIVSRLIKPGEVKTSGFYHKMVFGTQDNKNPKLLQLEKLLKDAEIDADVSKDIRKSVWKKFFFISVSASLTSYFNVGFNGIIHTDERREFTESFAQEFLHVAKAEGIEMEENALSDLLKRSEILPEGSTSSMHSDFKKGGSTELETLTGEIIRLAEKHKISVPLYTKVYDTLKAKGASE